ncbi:OLC1v1038265C1 [Oldenlandia corymbosa var. corymbosa]|uniref:OLC1v1038265C1 n=1 Tax=Oldenlandia corymbosa var. corymbosa TaxID=529605 RepID=A0AAV1CZI4_OLDCO|nr:OLC1v1038265C1 [Oldenlandia corymbosa var. corymbosa]
MKLVWRGANTLDFNCWDYRGGRSLRSQPGLNLVKAVTEVLFLREAGEIHSFRLSWNAHESLTSFVHIWVRHTVSCNLRVLDLCVASSGEGTHLPDKLLTCSTLETLRLSGGSLLVVAPSDVCLPKLEHLCLVDTAFDSDDSFRCLSDCKDRKLEIDAPALEVFDFSDSQMKELSMKRLTSVNEVKVDLHEHSETYLDNGISIGLCDSILNLIEGVKCAKSLTLNQLVVQGLSHASTPLSAMFERLTILDVECPCCHWSSLSAILANSIQLQVLNISMVTCYTCIDVDGYCTSKESWKDPKDVPVCLSQSLEEVSCDVESYLCDGINEYFAMLRYILKHGVLMRSVDLAFGYLASEVKTTGGDIGIAQKFKCLGLLRYAEPYCKENWQESRSKVENDYWRNSVIGFVLGASPPFSVMNKAAAASLVAEDFVWRFESTEMTALVHCLQALIWVRVPATLTVMEVRKQMLLVIGVDDSDYIAYRQSCVSVVSMASPAKNVSAVGEDASSAAAAEAMDVFRLIQAHQENAARLPPVEEIKTVLHHSLRGMLSTFSHKYEGYPSGSMVDFACDAYGSPILAVSSLAFHTKVAESDKDAIRTAYLARHPNAFWVDFGDFHFVRIDPKVIRYVSGVATAALGAGEFSKEEFAAAKVDPIYQFSKPIASHMNEDHADDTKLIVQHSTSVPVDFAYILDVDSLGLNVKAGYQGNTLKLRIPFPRRAADRKDVKTLIVEMLQAARDRDN